jgi:hypothetical protein
LYPLLSNEKRGKLLKNGATTATGNPLAKPYIILYYFLRKVVLMVSKFLLASLLALSFAPSSLLSEEGTQNSTLETPAPATEKIAVPDGIFFVLERLTTITDSGVVSAMPGTMVKLVKEGVPMRVTDGQHEFEAYTHQLTKDINTGRQLKQATEIKRELEKDKVAQVTAAYRVSQNPQPVQEDNSTEKASVNQSSAADRQSKIVELRAKIKEIRQEILDYQPERTHQHIVRPRSRGGSNGVRGGLEVSPGDKQNFITKKNREIEKLKEEIKKLGGNATFD